MSITYSDNKLNKEILNRTNEQLIKNENPNIPYKIIPSYQIGNYNNFKGLGKSY